MSLTDQKPHAPGESQSSAGKPSRVRTTVWWPYRKTSMLFIVVTCPSLDFTV